MADALLLQTTRQIIGSGGQLIIPDCIIEEVGKDALQITEHPVEQGSTISDHAFKKPREVTLRWSWTNSGHSDTYVQEIYNVLLTLQSSLNLFSLYIGKSSYINMLMESVTQTTNNASEYSLSIVALCKEVIIVSTSSVAFADQSSQSMPQKTAPVKPTGANQTIPKKADFPIPPLVVPETLAT